MLPETHRGFRPRPTFWSASTRLHGPCQANPTALWAARQIVEAFPFDTAPRFLLRDRDAIYGKDFTSQVKTLGIEEVLIAPQSPWQSPYVERVIGWIRRECLDHVIVWNESHLRTILDRYFAYYHESRAHLALDRNSPIPRQIEPPGSGSIVAEPFLGGLHHRYRRAA